MGRRGGGWEGGREVVELFGGKQLCRQLPCSSTSKWNTLHKSPLLLYIEAEMNPNLSEKAEYELI